MEREAQVPPESNAAPRFLPQGQFDRRPLSDLDAVIWREPPDWTPPEWLETEYAPASLPMTSERMQWCLHVIGWSIGELGRRIHTHDSSVRQMLRGRRVIPDTLAIWLEVLVARSLNGPTEPSGWRPKPMIGADGVPQRNPQT